MVTSAQGYSCGRLGRCGILLILSLLPGAVGVSSASASQTTQARELWEAPLSSPFRVSAPYALPNGPFNSGHRGIDLPSRVGDEVRAPASGIVTFTGTVVDRPVLAVRLDAQRVLSFEPIVSELRVGDQVMPGETIGAISTGGHCESACLHVGLRVDGAYANPLKFWRHRPVLLPW